ncbi:chemotaxis protein [Planomonospora parontospora subsp. parontospora]|uniref:Chemotaxis protein n=2 Tax=Planomonospora parontospora TaxID=58119 RepID=A0AA37BEE9_9ACTN|nr:PAS domain-containing protein [Planomonospora parontospora]GGK55984.1 chemotaxis protein [Planomonospora parontospora]GII07309.1 chemotaxis protein [Planomonospora parontospora subsp. parontospora]
MRASGLRPTGVERTFDPGEIIVTKTDLQGRITYANDVFLRVSAYPEDEMLGRPHNMIRHPDMPRCVFALLWETLKQGREIFAYIVNLAGDGAHYWVFAHVTPSTGARGQVVGYHSNRRVPSRSALRRVEPLYASLVAEERRHARPAEAVAAGTALLERTLEEQNMSYEEFVWSLAGQGAAR